MSYDTKQNIELTKGLIKTIKESATTAEEMVEKINSLITILAKKSSFNH